MESNTFPIMFLAIIFIITLVSLIITIVALVDILRNEFKGSNDKIIWVLLTIFISPIGGILYFIIGTKQKIGR